MKDVLIIGTGGIGKRHIRGFLKTGRARLSVVEPDAEKRSQVTKDYRIERDWADISKVDLGRFDAAVICAPAHVHVPLGQVCADAGLPFLLEKPLAVTMEGVDGMIRTVGEKGLVARVGYVRRASRETLLFRDEILAGRIGELRMCYVNASQEYPRYRPDYREIYYARPETGGGAILDAASHTFDLLLWIMGEVTEVCAMYDRLQLEGVEVEDSALISLRFRNGCMAQINLNQFQKPLVAVVEMIGTGGNLALDSGRGELRFADDDSGRWEVRDLMGGLAPMELHERRFRYQADAFMDILEGAEGNLTTLEEARQNLRVALAAKESYRTKRIVQLS